MDEFERAEAALAALRQAEIELDTNIAISGNEVDQAEASLAALDLDAEIPQINDEDWYDRPLDTTTLIVGTAGGASNAHYVNGIDPFTDATPSSNQGLISHIESIDNADNVVINYTTITQDEIEAVLSTLSDPIDSTEVKSKKVKSSELDDDEHLTIAEIKKMLKPILQDIYPDNWYWNRNDEIIIHFPKFTIINSINESHIINDMYVKLKYQHFNKSFSSSFEGARMRLTKSEASSSYAHSHLPSNNDVRIGTFLGFCLGTSTLNYLLSDLATLDMTSSNIEDIKLKFMFVLIETDNYLKWESLEGGPYRKIASIGSGNLNSIGGRDTAEKCDYIIENLYLEMLNYDYKPTFKFNDRGLLVLIDDDSFLRKVSEYCGGEYLVYRDGAGKFYSTKNTQGLKIGKINSNRFKFRGDYVYPELIDDLKKYEKSRKEFAHPEIIKGCKARLNKRINIKWVEELNAKIIARYSKRERQVKNTRKSIFTNIENVRNSIES